MHVVKAFHINCMMLWWYEWMSKRASERTSVRVSMNACATWMHAKWNWKWNVYESMGLLAFTVAAASAVVVFISVLLFSFRFFSFFLCFFLFVVVCCYCFLFSNGIACFCGYLMRSPKKYACLMALHECACACTFPHMLFDLEFFFTQLDMLQIPNNWSGNKHLRTRHDCVR